MKPYIIACLMLLISVAATAQSKKQKVIYKDSCVGCLFMGLTNAQWEKKDKPFWDSIDRAAIRASGGIYMGDLPSDCSGYSLGNYRKDTSYFESHRYHPSVDSEQVEKHYYTRIKPRKKTKSK